MLNRLFIQVQAELNKISIFTSLKGSNFEITSSPFTTSLRYTVYFWIIPFGSSGARHDTIEDVSPLVTTLISAGALGTKKQKKIAIYWPKMMILNSEIRFIIVYSRVLDDIEILNQKILTFSSINFVTLQSDRTL